MPDVATFNSSITVDCSWTSMKAFLLQKSMTLQFIEDTQMYTTFGVDGPIGYRCRLVKTAFSGGDWSSIPNYNQAQNDIDVAEFEASYKSTGNTRTTPGDDFRLAQRLRRFGNITTTSASEVLVSLRPYAEQATGAQRSVKSTSANDANPAGSGARAVRITYLDTNYVLKTEDVNLNGTTGVNTVATDIRFIEDFRVIKGAAAVGAITLQTTTAGGGTEICGIGAASNEAFLCHHYVPAGKKCYIMRWGASIDDDVSFKLIGQNRYAGNLVDEIKDLRKVAGASATPDYLMFDHTFGAMVPLPEKTYVRITCVPGQATSTVTRAFMELWEENT